ncbi:hypothetical protein Q9Q99_16725 [Curtobacterium flaccumfaciens]|nr:hypothetical protein Q9Q99_16725 [Curtobacterium flaccumfaciens]
MLATRVHAGQGYARRGVVGRDVEFVHDPDHLVQEVHDDGHLVARQVLGDLERAGVELLDDAQRVPHRGAGGGEDHATAVVRVGVPFDVTAADEPVDER